MNIDRYCAAAFGVAVLAATVSAGIMPIGPYHFRLAGVATSTDGTSSPYDRVGTGDDSADDIATQPRYIWGSCAYDATGLCAEMDVNVFHPEYLPGAAPNPSDPFSQYGSIYFTSRRVFSGARNFGAHAIALFSLSMDFAVDTTSQYWVHQSSPFGYAKLFGEDGSLLAGGDGKVSISGLLGPGTYRLDCLVYTEAWGEHRDAWVGDSQSLWFTIPSPAPLSLALLVSGLFCPRRRRDTR